MRTSLDLRRLITLVLLVGVAATSLSIRAEEETVPEPDVSPWIVVEGVIDRIGAARLASRIRLAAEGGAGALLLDLRAATAKPMEVLDLADAIYDGKDVKIVACASGRILGGAALLALACDEIVMTPSALLGAIDCGEGEADRSAVLAAARRYRGGTSSPLVAALVDPALEVYRLEFGNGTHRFAEEADLAFALRDERRLGGLTSRERLVRKDALLTLTAAQAVTFGLAVRTVKDGQEAAAALGLRTAARASARVTISDEWRPWKPEPSTRAAVIFVKGEIGPALEAGIRRRIETIKADGGFDLIVVETDSPGGTVQHSELIGDLLLDTGKTIHTVAWIPRRAISGACLTSFATRDILMGPAGTIGDCQPIFLTGEGYEVVGEKGQSPLRAIFRKYAEANGYPIAIAESMVTQEYEVLRVRSRTGTHRYFERTAYEALDANEKAAFGDPEVVVQADKLPTFTSKEAVRFGVARRIVESRKELLSLYGVTPENVTEFPITWSEKVSAWLLKVKVFLFLIGLIALYLEFKAPGFGVAGLIGIAAFALFFFAGTIGGVADSIEIVLFVVGIALILVELFVTPGFGLPGVAGILLIVVSLYLASTPFVVPNTPISRDYMLNWMLHFGGALVATIAFAVVAARFLPSVPVLRRIMLSPPADADELAASATRTDRSAAGFVGQRGVALTDLRPAGRAEFEGTRLDVVTRGAYIEEGTRVEIVKVKGNRTVVRPVVSPSDAEASSSKTDRDYNY